MAEMTTLEVVTQMEKYGGSFVKALAGAAIRADSRNLAKLKQAWPEYWSKYEKLAQENAAQRQRGPTIEAKLRPYICATDGCTFKAEHETNHFGQIYPWNLGGCCPGCRHAVPMNCTEEPPAGYEKPADWKASNE